MQNQDKAGQEKRTVDAASVNQSTTQRTEQQPMTGIAGQTVGSRRTKILPRLLVLNLLLSMAYLNKNHLGLLIVVSRNTSHLFYNNVIIIIMSDDKNIIFS